MYSIGLDLRPTEQGFKAHFGRGTGRYTSEVVRHIKELLAEDSASSFDIVPVHSVALEKSGLEKRLLEFLPCGRRTFESQVLFPRRVASLGTDLVHFFAHGDAPAWNTVAQSVTVLDLIPLRFPELYRARKMNMRFRFARHLEYEAIRRSLGILAISEATKRDVVELLGVDEEAIIVTPLAAGSEFVPREIADSQWQNAFRALREQFELPRERPVVLYVGGIDPRKNVSFLLEVFARLFAKSPEGRKPLLVLAGAYEKDEQYPRLLSQIERLELGAQVKLLGFVPDEKLPALYQSADVVVFPSLYEGFGLPALEAMACAVPVVAGDNSSLPEVVGDSAILCRDNDTEQWVEVLDGLLADETKRLELSRRGVKQAGLFSWRFTAEKTLEAFEMFLTRLPQRRRRISKSAHSVGTVSDGANL